jgi:hypothetical protein
MFWDVLNSQLYKGALDSQQQVIVYQLLAKGQWFSPGTPASSITKTGRHDIAEILLKVAFNTKFQIHNFIPSSPLYDAHYLGPVNWDIQHLINFTMNKALGG